MIKILIVDDDQNKVKNLYGLLSTIPGLQSTDVRVVGSLVEARDALSKMYFDLMLLDIKIPFTSSDLGSIDAGAIFVKELNASRTLIKPGNIIGFTAYDDALSRAKSTFGSELWTIVKYDPAKTDWSQQITSKISYMLQCKQELTGGNNAGYGVDLGIITALQSPELDAVLDLPAQWQPKRFANDPTEYYLGNLVAKQGRLDVIAASASQMGMAPASVLAMKVISHFRPRYLCMVGIAAGIKAAKVNLGDVLIADRSWDYESGKRRLTNNKPELSPDPHYLPLRGDLKEFFSTCVRTKAYVSEIESQWKAKLPSGERLKAVLGPIGSGSAVIADPNIVSEVSIHARKLVGIEMETYGLFYAAEHCSKPRPVCFSLKSACDFADADKDDDWQSYAAFTSAQYMWRFATEYLAPT